MQLLHVGIPCIMPHACPTHADENEVPCSAGILAYQLLTGRLPFIGDNGLLVSRLYMTKQIFSNKDVFRAILYADLDFQSVPWDTISDDAKDLVKSLLTRDAAQRPTAEESLAHPWFATIDQQEEEAAAAEADGSGSGSSVGACSRGSDGNGSGARASGGVLLDSVVQRLQRFGTYGRLKQVLKCSLRVCHCARALDYKRSAHPGARARADTLLRLVVQLGLQRATPADAGRCVHR
jgi:Protein kinase domain